MITKLNFGKPFETFAVIEPVEETKEIRHWTHTVEESDGVKSLVFRYNLSPEDIVYGLGETMHGINKRGGRYVFFNTDNSKHSDEMKDSLYSTHSFLIVDGKEHFGAYFDTPARVVFDVDNENSGKIEVYCQTQDLKLYELEGSSSYEITKEFLRVIGKSYIPPLWAFGFCQSRHGYICAKDVSKVVQKYENCKIPLDSVCMDIEYMDHFIDFTVHSKRYPNFGKYVRLMGAKGIHLVPIVDAGIAIKPGNSTYDEGIAKGYFCQKADGKLFKAAVWPGLTHFADFCRPEVRTWFGDQYKALTDFGLTGFWLDMNDPSIFWMEGKEPGSAKQLASMKGEEAERLTAASGKTEEYQSFYQEFDGRRMCHYDVHNVYGHFMTMATAEGLEKLIPDQRYLLYTRSCYIGTHRYGGMWTGDNHSLWAHLKRNVTMMAGLNMCGFLFSGADTGGFGKHATRELTLRWHALSAFTPLFRNHSSGNARKQECYRFPGVSDFRDVITIRYRILPYIYSEFVRAALSQDMYMKPLGFVWDQDPEARSCEDQLLVGENMMIAPVMEPGAAGRSVYLPVPMTEVRYDGYNFTERKVPAGRYEVEVPVNHVVFWILPGKAVPITKTLPKNTKEMDLSDVVLLGDGTEYSQYRDDGYTKDVCWEKFVKVTK